MIELLKNSSAPWSWLVSQGPCIMLDISLNDGTILSKVEGKNFLITAVL
jgi:hypothetical protein